MEHGRVILVAGDSADAVEPIRRALVQKGGFAVACCGLNAAELNGRMAHLEVVCCTEGMAWTVRGRSQRSTLGRFSAGGVSGPADLYARIAEIARHPVPVVFVHEHPTVDEVNYLRSCGAYYVLDRHADERRGWHRLLACVEQALAAEIQCSFCGHSIARLDGCVEGAGQAKLCRDCLTVFARDMLFPAAAEARYAN